MENRGTGYRLYIVVRGRILLAMGFFIIHRSGGLFMKLSDYVFKYLMEQGMYSH